MHTTSNANDLDLSKQLRRHFAPVWFVLTKGAERTESVASTFLFSVEDHVLLVTAGHVISALKSRASDGYAIRATIGDNQAGTVPSGLALPLPVDLDRMSTSEDHDGMDYGFIVPDLITAKTLCSGPLVPLTEKAWDGELADVFTYFLVGVPHETTKCGEGSSVAFRIAAIPLERTTPEKSGIELKSDESLYFRLKTIGDFDSIAGMSGGPIFAISYEEPGFLRYSVIGIQSSFNRTGLSIRACPVTDLGRALRRLLKEHTLNT